MVAIVAILQEMRINVYFILISESSPYVLSYRQVFLRCFRNPIRVPRIENRVHRIREIGTPHAHTGYLRFPLKKRGYRSIYSQVNTVGNYSNVLMEILFTNTWRQSVSKLPIPKLSLHNSAAFLSSAKASQRFAWKSNFLTCRLHWHHEIIRCLFLNAWQPTLKHSPLNFCTKQKKWGDMAYYIPPPEKVGGHVPRVPDQIAPMVITIGYWS